MKGGRFTDDFTIFGQISFSKGKVRVYDIFDGQENDLEVNRDTILINAYTYWERNLGCVNNTIPTKHTTGIGTGLYAAIRSIMRGEAFIACQCPMRSPPQVSRYRRRGMV